MRFTRKVSCDGKALRSWGCALVLLLSLTACSRTGIQPDAQSSAAEIPEGVPAGLDYFAPDENPYLAARGSAPKAARELFASAISAMEEKRWTEAENILLQVTERYPKLSGPYLNLGIVHYRTQQTELAEKAFSRAIEVNTLNLDAYNWLALLKREAGEFAAAEAHYQAALQVWPKHAPTHRNIGILYDLYMGELQQALQHFEIYRYLQGDEDRQVNGWIIDLNRRIQQQAGVEE